MIALALGAVVVAALLVAAMLPYESLAAAKRLGLRNDGTESLRRAAREARHRRRALLAGAVYPVLGVAALAAAGVAADVYTPWSRVALLFGSATSETALLSEAQVERVREQEMMDEMAVEAAEEVGLAPALGRGAGLGGFFLEHWPLRPLFVVLLGGALWLVYRRAGAAHRAYDSALRARHRDYHRHDLAPYTDE